MLAMKTEVLCIGHAAYDLSVFIESYPPENSKSETEDLLESCGGPASNAAYLLSKWNRACAFAGLVGDDRYGFQIAESLRSVGTDLSLLERRPGHATPVSMILVNVTNGSRTIVNRSRSKAKFNVRKADWPQTAPRVLLFDGHAREASLAALDAFPKAISILDAGSWREGTATLAGKVNYLVSSESFALHATNLGDLSTQERQRQCTSVLRKTYDTNIVITMGERGLIAEDQDGFRTVPAFPVTAIDTTAAGDIFHGAFAHGLCEAMSFPQILRFASMAAAISVQQRGGRSSIPTLQQVHNALQTS